MQRTWHRNTYVNPLHSHSRSVGQPEAQSRPVGAHYAAVVASDEPYLHTGLPIWLYHHHTEGVSPVVNGSSKVSPGRMNRKLCITFSRSFRPVIRAEHAFMIFRTGSRIALEVTD